MNRLSEGKLEEAVLEAPTISGAGSHAKERPKKGKRYRETVHVTLTLDSSCTMHNGVN